jgi:group I intron endonuclease
MSHWARAQKIYIGSAVNLSNRFKCYYSITYLTRSNNSYINNALIKNGYEAFSLTIIEYIDISNLSKDEIKTLILSREQHYIDTLLPVYNINPSAESRLGSLNSAETKAKMSKAKSNENHPMFGKNHSAEALAKISLANSGENHPMYGKAHSAETKAKISEALSGENNPMYGKTDENNPFYGKTHTPESKAKMSASKGGTIYVYNSDKSSLVNSFASARKAGEYFNCTHKTIKRYSKNGLIFKEQWILSTSLIF